MLSAQLKLVLRNVIYKKDFKLKKYNFRFLAGKPNIRQPVIIENTSVQGKGVISNKSE
jgi:hypothetical protein